MSFQQDQLFFLVKSSVKKVCHAVFLFKKSLLRLCISVFLLVILEVEQCSSGDSYIERSAVELMRTLFW